MNNSAPVAIVTGASQDIGRAQAGWNAVFVSRRLPELRQTPRGGRIINKGFIAAHAPRPRTEMTMMVTEMPFVGRG